LDDSDAATARGLFTMGHSCSKEKVLAPAKNLVVFEVLGGHVRDAEWRLGDWWTVGILGLKRPFVKVAFGAQVQQSEPKMNFLAQCGCDVNFDKRMVFSLDESLDVEGIQMTVRDQRHVQAALRGNPLIGKGEVRIDRDSGGILKQERVELRRNECRDPTGWLTIQYRVIKREAVRDTLLFLGAQSLRDIFNAMIALLQAPDGVKRLLATRPEEVAPAAMGTLFCGSTQEENLRKKLEPMAVSFCEQANSFREDTDDEVHRRLAPLSREILKLIAEFAQLEKDEEPDTVALATEWLKNLFLGCTEVDQSDEASDSALIGGERLRHWFTSSHIDPACLEPVSANCRKVEMLSRWTAGVHPPQKSILGSGAYSVVFLARDRETKQVCAVKQMTFEGQRAREAVTLRDCEVAEVLASSVHPCVVRLFGVHRPLETCALMTMEYCAGGDLQKVIQSHRKPGSYSVPPRANQWLAQLFLGLEFLHLSVKMLVRDVKPQNVILTKGWSCAKLADFGMSRLDTVSDGNFSFHPSVPPGSPLYVAPEVIKGEGYDYHADLYSMAVLAWVLYTGGIVSASTAMPPCVRFDMRQGPVEFPKLAGNWELLKACIVNPEGSDARKLPSEDTKDFILRLTNRSKDCQQLSHEDVRNHPLLRSMALPPHNDTAGIMQWLRSLGDDQFLACTA